MNKSSTSDENNTKLLATKEKPILKAFAEAPAPRRDYHALKLYQKYFTWTYWSIARTSTSKPEAKAYELSDFLKDRTLQTELTSIFGESTVNIIKKVANGQWELLTMPSNIIHKICLYINVCDVLALSQVCKRFSLECSNNNLWKIICKRQWKILLGVDVEKAKLIGWKSVYMEKMKSFRPAVVASKGFVTQSTIAVSSLVKLANPTDSKTLIKSNQSTHKHIREIKSGVSVRSNSEVFEKDFKASSMSTGKSTDRSSFISNKGKTYSRKFEISGNLPRSPTVNSNKFPQHSSQSVINFHSQSESLQGSERIRKSKSPLTTKKIITSARTRSTTSQSKQPMDDHSKLKNPPVRPVTGKSTKSKK